MSSIHFSPALPEGSKVFVVSAEVLDLTPETTCRHCGKNFKTKYDVTRHKRSHTGVKPFECGTCHARFTTSANLKRHERTHAGSRPFTCSACGKAYTRRLHLTLHLRDHAKDKPHKCPQCDRGFSRRHHVRDHLYHKHGYVEPFKMKEPHKPNSVYYISADQLKAAPGLGDAVSSLGPVVPSDPEPMPTGPLSPVVPFVPAPMSRDSCPGAPVVPSIPAPMSTVSLDPSGLPPTVEVPLPLGYEGDLVDEGMALLDAFLKRSLSEGEREQTLQCY